MKKILEIKDTDWTKGNSAQTDIPSGGLFGATSNFNPFAQGGVFIPSLTPDIKPLSTTPKFLTPFNSASVDYIYVHTDTKLYQVLKDSPYTITDVTAQVNQ